MIKKIFLLFSICILLISAVSASEDWSDYNNIDNAWDGQKTITNKQFEETMNALQAKAKRKEAKQREKAIRKVKGSSLIPQMDAHNDNMINENPDEISDEGQLINIPVDFIVDGQTIDRGFYKIVGMRKQNSVYLMLFQAHTLKAKIKAIETEDDFSQDYVQFVKILPHDEHRMKIIFGSLEFNAFAYINFIEPIISLN